MCLEGLWEGDNLPKAKLNLIYNSIYMSVMWAAEPVAYPYLQEVIPNLPSIILQRR